MIIRENISFKRGQDVKKALDIGVSNKIVVKKNMRKVQKMLKEVGISSFIDIGNLSLEIDSDPEIGIYYDADIEWKSKQKPPVKEWIIINSNKGYRIGDEHHIEEILPILFKALLKPIEKELASYRKKMQKLEKQKALADQYVS